MYPDVSLKDARDKARDAKKLVSEGVDTSLGRRKGKQKSADSFEAVAREWYEKQEVAVRRRMEILSRLISIDAESVRPLRAIANGDGIEADHSKIAVLDKEADALRAELATLFISK